MKLSFSLAQRFLLLEAYNLPAFAVLNTIIKACFGPNMLLEMY